MLFVAMAALFPELDKILRLSAASPPLTPDAKRPNGGVTCPANSTQSPSKEFWLRPLAGGSAETAGSGVDAGLAVL